MKLWYAFLSIHMHLHSSPHAHRDRGRYLFIYHRNFFAYGDDCLCYWQFINRSRKL
uniref:Uncharacterized protein n=1 Tax=Rhizophora mucronata TaxID=61149 RepID=A0A2P2QIB5_RHIMU